MPKPEFSTPAPIVAVVLAAGQASRFGNPKLLVPFCGRPLIRYTVERLLEANIGEILVVIGPQRAVLAEALSGLPVRLVSNPKPENGLSSSLKVGIMTAGKSAVLVCLGDQPTVSVITLRTLASVYRSSGAPVVCPTYNGELGNPVLFSPAVFPEILRLTGDRGARQIVEHSSGRKIVPFNFSMPRDVDTPDDLAFLSAAVRFYG